MISAETGACGRVFFVEAVESGGLRRSLPSGRALGPVGLQPALRTGSKLAQSTRRCRRSRRRCFAPRVIRVDDALCGAARCRSIALWQRGIGAFKVIVVPALVDLQADRIGRVIRLGASRRRCRKRSPSSKLPKPDCAFKVSLVITNVARAPPRSAASATPTIIR
jgi:hypothetical protein